MTYCLGIITSSGLVIAADSRTNAGVDYVSTYQKLFDFTWVNERVLILCTSGNLSITQGVLNLLNKDLRTQAESNLHTLPTMYEIAQYVGSKVRSMQEQNRPWLQKDGIDAQCNLLLGGQIQGEEPELYMVYSQGNFIQATKETPFLQIGETKYGKPILDRTLTFETSIEAAAKCALLSIDSTMKSNISVGPPINLIAYDRDSFETKRRLTLRLGDPYLVKIRKQWEVSLRQAFERMPDVDWQHNPHSKVDIAYTDSLD
ncbi:proteasome-type protease [Tumidithrix elongata RA019]|uniref:Proteasome-type protease n=1 Tax=Tumidithrix elongata BACA0141 TaxID=2716417 RepID=A0AAW9Q4W8_9CYAN|nr:proteasome-type protease [Tumidithrix elongata RA019]